MISGVLIPLAVAVIASPRRGRGDLAGEIASAGCARLAMTANGSTEIHPTLEHFHV